MSEEIIVQNNLTRAKFTGFGESYGEYDIADRVNELMEKCKKEYKTIDNWLLWVCTVDYVLRDEMGVNLDTDKQAKEWYDNFVKERQNLIYHTVSFLDSENKPIEVNE